jgi:hypothetical protein
MEPRSHLIARVPIGLIAASVALAAAPALAHAATASITERVSESCSDPNNCVAFAFTFTATPELAGYHVTLSETASAFRDQPGASTSWSSHSSAP